MGKVIYIDGMDCCGKSTAIDILMSNDIFVRRRHRSMSDNPFIDTFLKTKKRYAWNSIEVSNALLEAVKFDITNYNQDQDIDRFTIQESTILLKGFCMLLSDQYFINNNQKTILQFYQQLMQHPKFDYAFFITTNKQTRIERVNKRIHENDKISDNDLMILKDYPRFERINHIMNIIMKKYFNATTINTTYLSPKEIASIILHNINP